MSVRNASIPLGIRGIRTYGCTPVYGIHVGVGVGNNVHLRTTKFSMEIIHGHTLTNIAIDEL